MITFENLPSTKTPINAENLNFNFNEVLNLVYPIGRGFIDFTDTDYSNYLGFRWERTLVGLTPIGKDTSQTEFNTLGKRGGEKTHKLTEAEMPSHGHNISVNQQPSGETGLGFDWSFNQPVEKNYTYSEFMRTAGNDQPHNNLQPYEVVNYWKRIA